MYRFAARPRWILSHVFVIAVIVLCINLGFWQLRRHDDRAARNDAVRESTEQAPVPLSELLDGVPPDGSVESLRYLPVTVEGTYVDDATLFVDNRSNDGLPGAWVVTPLRTDDGALVAVSRGFLGSSGGALEAPAPPDGPVSVTGTALPFESGCGVRAGPDDRPIGMSCLDREVVEQVTGEPVELLAVQQRTSSAGDQGLVPVPLPELDAGPHRSYAVQWFIFATIALVGYPLVLRRVARDRQRDDVEV